MVVKFDQQDYYAKYLLEYDFVPYVPPRAAGTNNGRAKTTGGRKRGAAAGASANDSADDVQCLN
jgi:hypothetical protein